MGILVNLLVILIVLAIVYLIGREILKALGAPPIFLTVLYLVLLLVLLLFILGAVGVMPGWHWRITG